MAVFQFNGYDLNDYFKLIKVSHEIGNERNITTDSALKSVSTFNRFRLVQKNQAYCQFSDKTS
jgi:hypothetical protein